MSRASDELEARGRAYDARLLRRLLGYLRPYRWLTAGAIVVLMSQSALALVGPRLTQHALDVAVPRHDLGLLTLLAGLYLATLLLDFVVSSAVLDLLGLVAVHRELCDALGDLLELLDL